MAPSSHRLASLIAALLLSTCIGFCKAQETGGERYYFFQASGISSPQREKQLTEILRGFDGEMVVSLDQPTQRLKLLTTVVLNDQEVIAMAGQLGVTLVRIATRQHPSTPLIAE